ncbi:MAG: hypothetical protein AB3N21_09090 [Ruegeria sp.]|uniref:hypothetical protein n=1 Tax=Ruegeria sp. TaxID=1879320 RepID=UPI00349E9552
MEEGLVCGHGFAVAASLIVADAQIQNSSKPEESAAQKVYSKDSPRAVREYLGVLDDAAFGAACE